MPGCGESGNPAYGTATVGKRDSGALTNMMRKSVPETVSNALKAEPRDPHTCVHGRVTHGSQKADEPKCQHELNAEHTQDGTSLGLKICKCGRNFAK